MKSPKQILRDWLGIGKPIIGIDIGMRQSCIVIVSHLDGGRVQIIDTHFNNVQELNDTIRTLSNRFNVERYDLISDKPRIRGIDKR